MYVRNTTAREEWTFLWSQCRGPRRGRTVFPWLACTFGQHVNEVVDKGIGSVGNIPLRGFIWDLLAPLNFSHVAPRDLRTMPDISLEGIIMARAFVRDGVLKPCGGRRPNRYLLSVPKNATKASMIVHLVRLHKKHQSKPHSFCLPFVEDLAFRVQVHPMLPRRLSMSNAYMSYLNDPFRRELNSLRVQASANEELVACNIDLTNAFRSLTVPEALQGTFRVHIDGEMYGFSFLPFGWQFHP